MSTDKNKRLGRFVLPYCIEFLDQHRFVVLNREYKPIGLLQKEWVEYEAFAFVLKRKLTRRQLDAIDGRRGGDASHRDADFDAYDAGKPTHLYLFSDANAPWDGPKRFADYSGRLNLLHALELDFDATYEARRRLISVLPRVRSPLH